MVKGKEPKPNKIYWLVYCHKCRKYQPRAAETYKLRKDKAKITITMIYCPVCETVLNMDKVPKQKKLRYSEIKKKGWTITTKH